MPAVSASDLTVQFGDTTVLDTISVDIPAGSITALIGPNGSGKTTLLKALLELVPRSQGEVLFFGKPLRHNRTRIGYVPQRFTFTREFPITVREFMALAIDGHEPTRITEKLHEVGLPTHVEEKLLGTLSGGQLQRVLIAQAFLNDPDILFLDEPATGIDVVGEADFYDIIQHLNQDHGTTIVLVSHDVGVVADLVDQVICINKKLLCVGSPKRTLTKKTLESLYGADVNAYVHHRH